MTQLLVYGATVAIVAIGMGYDVGHGNSSAGPEVVVCCAVFWPVVLASLIGHRVGYWAKRRESRRNAR